MGKHLYMHFDGGLVLHTHMRMTGEWHVYSSGEPWRRGAHRATAVLDFGDVEAVLFAAPVCELVGADAVGSGLGPDILGPDLDIGAIAERARRSRHTTLAEVLIDQWVCAGIGNIYRCEALWHERVDPFVAVAGLDDDTIARVLRRARSLLRRAATGGAFLPGAAVHGRAGRPCPACGTSVMARAFGKPARTVFWCPACQRGVSRVPAPSG